VPQAGWTVIGAPHSLWHVIDARPATARETESWLEGWRARLQAWYTPYGPSDLWVDHHIQRRLRSHNNAAQAFVFVVTSDGDPVGILAAAQVENEGPLTTVINDLWVAPEHRRRGYATSAVEWTRSWAASRTKRLAMVTDPTDPAHMALFGQNPLRAQMMIKQVSGVDSVPDGHTGRPMTEAEFVPWRAEQVRGYAGDIFGSGLLPLPEATTRAETQFDELLPQGMRTADNTFLCVDFGGEVVATIWLSHHYHPGTSWVFGVEVSQQSRGRGHGRAAMLLGEQSTLTAGDTHLALNVFGNNTTAIGLYDRLGYGTVDQQRSVDL